MNLRKTIIFASSSFLDSWLWLFALLFCGNASDCILLLGGCCWQVTARCARDHRLISGVEIVALLIVLLWLGSWFRVWMGWLVHNDTHCWRALGLDERPDRSLSLWINDLRLILRDHILGVVSIQNSLSDGFNLLSSTIFALFGAFVSNNVLVHHTWIVWGYILHASDDVLVVGLHLTHLRR